MKTLHLYLTRQVLATLAMTVLVFTGILLLGNVLKEILSLLVNRQASLWVVVQAIGLLIPFVLVFALPMGMLTATLLVFGRFSADQELTAVRAGGISLVALTIPILILSCIFSGLCAWVNLELAPHCRTAYKDLLFSVGLGNPASILQENQYVHDLPGGYTIYVAKINGENLQDIYIHQANEAKKLILWMRAPTGQLVHDKAAKKITLTLFDARGERQEGDNSEPQPMQGDTTVELDDTLPGGKTLEPKLSDMTFRQLREKIRDLETKGISPVPALVQLHRMVSFSFASLGFTLIGIPLGIRAHRRETSIGVAIALSLVLVYYSFIILGQSLDTRPEFLPHLILWLPNFIFQAAGAILLWRANKGI